MTANYHMDFWQVAWQGLANETLCGDWWRGYFVMTKRTMERVGCAKVALGLGLARTLI